MWCSDKVTSAILLSIKENSGSTPYCAANAPMVFNGIQHEALVKLKYWFESDQELKNYILQVREVSSNLQCPREEIVYMVKTMTVKFVEVAITTLNI